jgi:RimJ/RimL family protein N-acetyltransferase
MITFDDARLATERLALRPFADDDVPDVARACSDEETQRWLPLPDPYTEDDARLWCTVTSHELRTSGSGLQRATVERTTGRLVGSFGLVHTDWRDLSTEVGYWVAPWGRGRGFATEAARALSEWALHEQGFERVQLRAATGNAASNRVAEKAGFTREGVARNAGTVPGGRVDLVVWSLVAGDLS